MTLASGARLGPYEIRGAVGSGGMGEVYRAHDPRLGRDVALKILPESMATDVEGLARFTREARAVAALNHPHIVTIFSTEEADGVRFMTMELIEGRTLDRIIPESGVSLSQFFDVATALADALSAAHQKQITHRDLKPANVMVTDAGRVKVLDFGLARGGEGGGLGAMSFEEEATRQKLTQAGTILGTMPYMSPEQIEAKPLDGRSDIFSLGIVMYEMATGGRPFKGESSPALMSSIMREHPKPAAELRSDLPADLSQLVGKCLEKHPRDRVQTAQEILLELKALRRAWESGTSAARPKVAAPLGSASRVSNLRIAVLPFVPRPATGDAESLAEGLTDDITAGLARFPNMRLVSRPEADRVKGLQGDASLVSQLGARYLLDGTVRTSSNSVRVSARLVDASSGTHMWSETYERPLSDGLFALQDAIAHRVVATVADSSGVLVRSMGAALKDRPAHELTILEALIRFEAYVQRYRGEEHLALRDALETVVERDPSDAEAWGCLAALISHEHLFGLNAKPDILGRTRAAADRAIEIDSNCHRGWTILACAHFIGRDLSGFRAAASRVIEINPLDTAKLSIIAWMLVGVGDIEHGLEVARQSMALHSNFAAWYRMPVFTARYIAREYQAALEEAKRINIDTFRFAHLALASAAGQLGAAPDAKAALKAMARIEGGPISPERAREIWGLRVWSEDVIDHLMEGFEAACALAGADLFDSSRAGSPRPSSGPSIARIGSGKTAAGVVNRAYVVAIHPFATHGSDEESIGLARGLTEDIGTALSRFQLLTVRTSKDADARYAVEGSVRRSGNSVRASARLVDTDTGASTWAENYDRMLGATSFFELQDEMTARVVSTIGSTSGPLIKAMASPLRERPVTDLTLHELVLRCNLYFGSLNIDEHAILRTALERALADQPGHALGWAALSTLYESEVSWGMNPLPDAMGRCTRAARRSVEIDPACQLGWSRLMTASFHVNDWNGLRNAGDRVLALNPLSQNTVGVAGLYFAFMGDWDRGIPMVRRAIDLDPNHLGMLHTGLFVDHYRKKDYEEALAQAKRINAFETATVALSLASAAGQLGRADESRAALEALDRRHPSHRSLDAARSHWAWFLRDRELIDRLMEGFEKARALVVDPAPSAAIKAPTSGRTASIAVLPFTDMSASKDQDWFCDGIAEEILNALSGLKGLSVAARASAFSFRGKGDDLKAIGDKLHVTTVLDGSVRRAGDQLRITVRLSEVANGYQLWSERYDRPIDDIFNVQDEIAKAVAGRLRLALGDDPANLPRVVRHTQNQEAYDLYLRGRHHWYSRNRGALQKALQYYQQAAEKDPNYPLPWVGLTDLYTVQGIYAYERATEVGPKARASLETALVLNDRLADTHRARGFMQIFFDWDLKAAVKSLEKSVEMDPTSALSYAWLAWASVWPGRKEAALAASERARELDPLNIYIISITAQVFNFWGFSERGRGDARKALDMDPNSLVGLYVCGGICSRLGHHREARDAFSRAVDVSERAPYYVGYLAWAEATAGNEAQARKGLAELESRSATEYVAPLFRAMVHAALGERDRAFALLDEAVVDRNCWLASPRLPLFDGFRKDPRFADHLRLIGHPDEADSRSVE